mgnify:CR=1 FL=1
MSSDVYEELFRMYSIFRLDRVADSFRELLRAQFTPEEAELALKVGFKGGKLAELEQRTGLERGRLKQMLEAMALKGTIWIDPGAEDPTYRTIGLAGPGLVETGGWGNIKFPHSVRVLQALHRFERDFALKWLPAVGAPVTRVWLTPAALPQDARPEENVAEMMRRAGPPWGVSTCSCRLPHWVADPGNHCRFPLETCLFSGEMARWGLERGMCREISWEGVEEILRSCNQSGLVHTHDPGEFVCNCCNDCCVMLMGQYVTGARILRPSEFVPRFDRASCTACGLCAQRCPVDALSVDDFPILDEERCLGCGVCYPTCPTGAIGFVRRPAEPDKPAGGAR